MKKEIIRIKDLAPATFNHVVKAGGFLFFSSQLSVDLRTSEILPGAIADQTRQVLENLKFLLESAGGTMEDIGQIVIYLRDTGFYEVKIGEELKTDFTLPESDIETIGPVMSSLLGDQNK